MTPVQIITESGWITRRLSEILARDLSYVSIVKRPTSAARVVYYLTYLWMEYHRPNPRFIEVGFFTHVEGGAHTARYNKFAKRAVHCTVMSGQDQEYVRQFNKNVHLMPVPVDPKFHPRPLKVGWYNVQHKPRKRFQWVNQLMSEPWLEFEYSNGDWTLDQVSESMRRQDVVLVTANQESGPMSLVEALATGIPCVIGNDVGMAPDFSEWPDAVVTYDTGDLNDLRDTLYTLYSRRLALVERVRAHTEAGWVRAHNSLFQSLLR